MRNDQTVTIRRADYRPPDFLLDHVALEFDLDPKLTYVTATLDVRRNPLVGGAAPLRLDGEDLELALIAVDGHALPASAYQVRDDGLTLRLRTQSNRFQLKTVVRIDPSKNTELMGLFVSNGNFFTQCEAEGFRRITFFPDRPDVMTTYRVTIRADKSRYPVLLANGNLIEQGDLSEGRHFAVWDDPFAKPSYLFALFAGNVAMHEDHFTRASGRDATLQIYVEHGNEDKTQHAMASL
ncbi:MAG TPA: aminopeptidase N, partial [Burkholderiaceae bacterium]|nr:aminopeptidase N [Burkholderiaceae bacterium]